MECELDLQDNMDNIYNLVIKAYPSKSVMGKNQVQEEVQWPVFVHDGIERQAISPAGCEVVDVDIGVTAGVRTKVMNH